MPLQAPERPLELAPNLPIEPASPPVENGWSKKWQAVIALGVSGLGLAAVLHYGGEDTTEQGNNGPTPTMPVPRSDDGTPEPVEPLITIPTQPTNPIDFTTPPTMPPTVPSPSNQITDRTAAASSDRQVTTEKPPLPQRERTPWTEYTTRGR